MYGTVDKETNAKLERYILMFFADALRSERNALIIV